jgi:hypothetical protein
MFLYIIARNIVMEQAKSRSPIGPWTWGVLFFVATFGAGIGARIADLSSFWSMAVMLPPMLLLIPLVRSGERLAVSNSAYTPALRNYNRRSLIWSFAYVASLFAAISIDKAYDPSGIAAVLVAVLPALPVLYFIWALGRYLTEEQDEYIRMQQVRAALIATAILLGVGTVWGFLDTFGLVPGVPGWAVVPVWAIGLGIGNLINMRLAK